jgi:hypothetical protein
LQLSDDLIILIYVSRTKSKTRWNEMNKMHIYYNGKLDETIWCGNQSGWKDEAMEQAKKRGFWGKGYTFAFEE